jgi:NIPSNAP
MITELRRYSIVPGRMEAMHARMKDLLLPLFVDLKLPSPTAIWETQGQRCVFTWIIEWENFDARTAGWARYNPHFYAARMQQDIEEFVTRTDVTLINPWLDAPFEFPSDAGVCETLWLAQPVVLHGAAFRTECLKDQSALFCDVGAISISGCDIVFGPLPNAAVFLSWPDVAARDAGMAELAQKPVCDTLQKALGIKKSVCDHGDWSPLDHADYTWRPKCRA